MKCKQAQKLLYNFLTHSLEEEERQLVKEHMEACRKCQDKLKDMKATIAMMDTWKSPAISPNFEEKVLQRIRQRKTKLEGDREKSKVRILLEMFFSPCVTNVTKIPKFARGGAGIAIVILMMIMMRGFLPKGVDEGKIITRQSEITLNEAKNPIVIEVAGDIDDTDKVVDQLKEIVGSYNGNVVQDLSIEGGRKLTIEVAGEKEFLLLDKLSSLGKVKRKNEGYKDTAGYIVIIVKGKSESPSL